MSDQKFSTEADDLTLARKTIEQATALLNAAWSPEHMGYDVQGVNQAHRVLCGGEAPRVTRAHDVDEGAP